MTGRTAAERLPSLERQWLDGTCPDIMTAVEHLGGLNAQTPRGPSLGLLARVRDFRQEDLDVLLRGHELVKASLVRGTVHLVTARQFRTWRAALQPALERTVKQFCPRLWDKVDHDALLQAGSEVLAEHAGQDGLTRKEIGELLQPRFPEADTGELGFAIRLLAPVVQVPDETVWRPGRTRYVLAEEVMDGDLIPAEDGLQDLLTTYATAYGPFTAADATYYTGMTGLAATLKATCDIVGGTGRSPVFDSPSPAAAHEPRAALVLPEYDSIYFAHKEGSCRAARKRLIPNTAVDMLGSVLHDGVLVASWKPTSAGSMELDGEVDAVPQAAREAFCAARDLYEQTSAH